jgi:hypothetical protein
MVHKCPYKKACPGEYNAKAWSIEYRTFGDVRRQNPPETAPPSCTEDEDESNTRCCPYGASNGTYTSDANLLKGTTTGLESGTPCYWGKPIGPVCGKGYKGAVCAVCAEDYSFSGKSCNSCNNGFQLNAMFISFILIIVLVLYEVLGKVAHMRTNKQKGESKSLSALMKRKKQLARTKACVAQIFVIVAFAQVLCTFADTTNVEFPDAFDELGDSMQFLNFDMVNVASALCYYKADYYDTLQAQFWWPTLLILLLIGDHIRERKTRSCGNDPDDEYAGVSQIKAIVMVLITAFPLNVLIYLKFFLCREIDGEWYLQADYRYQCFDSKWNSYLALTLPGLIVYIIGTPIFFVSVLWYHSKQGTLAHPVNEDKYSFLFLKYKKEYWYMEAYMLMVKLTLVGVIMYILKGSATQVTVSFVFAALFLVVSLNTSPFKNNDMNSGEMITRCATMVTLFCALLIKVKIYDIDEWDQGVLNGILMFVNLCVMIVFIYRFVRVQGLFLCDTYGPECGAAWCKKCFQYCGWRDGPAPVGADDKGDDGVEEIPLLGVVSLKQPASFQQQTFKCVS